MKQKFPWKDSLAAFAGVVVVTLINDLIFKDQHSFLDMMIMFYVLVIYMKIPLDW